MTPFEAHILIQQEGSSHSRSNSRNSLSSLETTTSTTHILDEALKSQRLNPNGAFKKESFLCTAIKRNSPNLLKLLLKYGASPDLKSYENGRYEPALITAVRYKSLTCVEILLEYGANVNKTNFYGSDAIFQAVYENAFSILECLLAEHHPRRNGRWWSDRRGQEKYEPPPQEPIVIQKVTATKEGKTCVVAAPPPPATTLNIKEGAVEAASHNKRGEQDDEDDYNDYDHNHADNHVLCPFFFALNNATKYPCKKESLVRLLQSYYKCKCVQEIASCCAQGKKDDMLESGSKFLKESGGNKGAIFECLAALNSFLSENLGVHRKSGEFSQTEGVGVAAAARNSESMNWTENSEQDHYDKPNIILEGDDDDGNWAKFGLQGGNEKLGVYKIWRIEGKCHTIKENEASSSGRPSSSTAAASYLVLVGPLKLSCMVREVIRNQIMLYCTTSSTRNSNFVTSNSNAVASASVLLQKTTARATVVPHTLGGKLGKCRNFRKCLECLMIPAPLKSYILYRDIRAPAPIPKCRWGSKKSSSSNTITLIKKDLMLNVNYFACFIP